MFSIRFIPEGRSYTADGPVELFLAAAACDIWLEQPCGSKTTCGKCRVRALEGAPSPTEADVRLLSEEERGQGWRLACQLTLDGPAVVEIPAMTRSVAAKTFGPPDLYADGDFEPNVRRAHLEVTPPGEHNQHSTLDLLARAAGVPAFRTEASLLRSLPRIAGPEPCPMALVWASDESNEAQLIDVRVDDGKSPPAYGVAVDLGSTTLAAALVDLETGGVAATVSRLNPQVRYGGDVISRIHYAQDTPGGNEKLHEAVMGAVGQMIEEVTAQAGARPSEIFALTFAGNPTMLHTAAGANIVPLGHAPYVGLWTRELTLTAEELGLPVHPRAVARFLPMIRSHVGADTVGGVLACGMDESERWQLLIDLGTNSEVVLGRAGQMVATSTAAGPAFEGANIYQGMRAAPGAIDTVRVRDGRVVVGTIAHEPACGICGSGLIDAAAEFCRAGLIAPSGYLCAREELKDMPEALVERIVALERNGRQECLPAHGLPAQQRAIRLTDKVALTAQDIRQLRPR